MHSQENRFDTFIASSGYEVVGDYTAGPLTITSITSSFAITTSCINSPQRQISRLPRLVILTKHGLIPMLRILYLSVMQRFAKTWVQATALNSLVE
jgi:hypothetical protein